MREGHLNACRFLITHKIDTLIVSGSGQTAFDIAATPNIQQLLLSMSAIDAWKDFHARVFFSIACENEKLVSTPNATDLELQLLEASKSGDLDVVKVCSFDILSLSEKELFFGSVY